MENNLTGKGRFLDKLKSRTVILVFGALFAVIGKWMTFPHDEAAASLVGLAAVIAACGGLHIFNKTQEAAISIKQGKFEYTKDTRKSGDTLVSGITGNVTKI